MPASTRLKVRARKRERENIAGLQKHHRLFKDFSVRGTSMSLPAFIEFSAAFRSIHFSLYCAKKKKRERKRTKIKILYTFLNYYIIILLNLRTHISVCIFLTLSYSIVFSVLMLDDFKDLTNHRRNNRCVVIKFAKPWPKIISAMAHGVPRPVAPRASLCLCQQRTRVLLARVQRARRMKVNIERAAQVDRIRLNSCFRVLSGVQLTATADSPVSPSHPLPHSISRNAFFSGALARTCNIRNSGK